jgi:hypothetical protein
MVRVKKEELLVDELALDIPQPHRRLEAGRGRLDMKEGPSKEMAGTHPLLLAIQGCKDTAWVNWLHLKDREANQVQCACC